jgi:hypothetical protein
MPDNMTTLFREYIIKKYSSEYKNFDEDELVTVELCDFVEEYCDNIGLNVSRRYFNWLNFVNDCIDDDDYQYYHFNDDCVFEEAVPSDDDMCTYPEYNKTKGEREYEFGANDDYFICYYRGKTLILNH